MQSPAALQLSPVVHALVSSQRLVVSIVFEHPTIGLQTSSVHALPSSQLAAVHIATVKLIVGVQPVPWLMPWTRQLAAPSGSTIAGLTLQRPGTLVQSSAFRSNVSSVTACAASS